VRDVFGLLRINTPKALELLKEIVDENPKDVGALCFYADILKEATKFDEAEAVYQQILTLDPTNIQALMAMAGLFYIQDKTDEADKYVLAAEKTGKVSYNNYGDLGFALIVAGKDKEAAKYYEKSVALQPNGHDFYNLACAYAKSGDKNSAFKALENCLKYGYGSKDLFEHDADLKSLRNDSRFKEILSKIKS
jgi:Flp pilus assembly protein TadD